MYRVRRSHAGDQGKAPGGQAEGQTEKRRSTQAGRAADERETDPGSRPAERAGGRGRQFLRRRPGGTGWSPRRG